VDLRKLLVGLIVVATAIFGVAVTLERSNADPRSARDRSEAEEAGGEDSHTGEGEPGGEATETSASGTEEATVLGVDPEATPTVVLVVIASLSLAAAIWFRPGWRWILLVAVLGMLIFTVLDVREAVHQFSEANSALGLSAMAVAFLHGSAASIAVLFLRRQPNVSANTDSLITTRHDRE
jgi:hypothetical protein